MKKKSKGKVGDEEMPRYSEVFLDKLPRLAQYDTFCLSGIAIQNDAMNVWYIYPHSKVMIVDDEVTKLVKEFIYRHFFLVDGDWECKFCRYFNE